MIFVTYRRNTVSTQESTKKASAPFQLRLDNELRDAKERYVVQLRLDAELSERLSKAMKEDGDDNKAGWIKRLLRRELDKRGIPSTD